MNFDIEKYNSTSAYKAIKQAEVDFENGSITEREYDWVIALQSGFIVQMERFGAFN